MALLKIYPMSVLNMYTYTENYTGKVYSIGLAVFSLDGRTRGS